MINRLIISLTLCITYSFTLAQFNRDSLLTIIESNEATQSQKIQALNDLAYRYRVSHPDSTLILGQEGLLMAEEIDDRLGVANAMLSMSTGHTNLGNYYEAIKGFREARLIFEELKETERIATCVNNIGALYNSIKDYNQALEYFLQALILYEEINATSQISASINNVGYIYKIIAEYDLALEYLYRSLTISKDAEVDFSLYPIYNIGSTYMHLNNWDSSYSYLTRALEMSRKLNDNYVLSLTLMDLGLLHLNDEQIDQAETFFLQANAVANKANLRPEELKSVQFLSEVYENQGKTELALKYYKLYKNKNDSLYNIELNKKMAFLEAESKLSEDEIMREILEREKELIRDRELAEAIWARNSLILALILMVIIAYLLYMNARRRKTANEDLRTLNAKIEAQATELQAANEEISGMNANLEELVNQRTEEVKKKNRQLQEYLSSNSHIIRAPLARILGLAELYDPEDTENIAFINENIHESAKELDDALRDINEKLSES